MNFGWEISPSQDFDVHRKAQHLKTLTCIYATNGIQDYDLSVRED